MESVFPQVRYCSADDGGMPKGKTMQVMVGSRKALKVPSSRTVLHEKRAGGLLLQRLVDETEAGRIFLWCRVGRARMTHSLVYTFPLTCFQKGFE